MLSFKDLSEKKTKVKINPKKDDLLEKSKHPDDCTCEKCEEKDEKEPTVELGDFSTSFSDVKFDFIYAYSVFTHVDPPLIIEFFDNFKDKITTDTKIFVTMTILEEEGWEIRGGKHKARENEYTGVWYNLNFFNDLIGKNGFRVVTDDIKNYRPTSMEVVGPPRPFTLDGNGTHRMILLEKK